MINQIVFTTKHREGIQVVHLANEPEQRFSKKADQQINIDNYFYFFKAVNHYIIQKELVDQAYISSRTYDYDVYRAEMLKNDYKQIISLSGSNQDAVEEFVKSWLGELNPVIVFQEKYVSANASMALHNLVMLTGKLGKTGSGLIALKETNNAHGIFDMGACHKIGVGAEPILDEELQFQMGKNGVLWICLLPSTAFIRCSPGAG